MSDPKYSGTGADWTQLLTDPALVSHLGELLQVYRDTPAEQRDQALLEAMRKIPTITDVNSDQQNHGLQIYVQYDRTTAARFGRFGLVGISGLAVNSLALVAFRDGFGFSVLAAALLATQVSSVWNFLLTERFVFRGTSPSRSFGGRALAFLVMNNLAFLLRGPLLLGLMSAFGLHYVLANLISLSSTTAIALSW
jgi:putative flippase GtrA